MNNALYVIKHIYMTNQQEAEKIAELAQDICDFLFDKGERIDIALYMGLKDLLRNHYEK